MEPDVLAFLGGDDAGAVVLNLVQPHPAGRRARSFGRQTGRDDASR
jgi:hypothetical protein